MDRKGIASSTILVFLPLFLFNFSSAARTPLDRPGFGHTNHDSFSESEKNPAEANAIFLPSEKHEIEPETLIQWEPETTDSKISIPEPETVASMVVSTDQSSDPDPFTVIGLRSSNLRIPRSPSPLSFRLGHRCRHNHRFKPWNPRLPRRETPYGDDVILNNVEGKNFDPVDRGGARQIPARWMRSRHIEPRFFLEPSMDTHSIESSEVMRRLYHRRRHHHHREPENKDTGLMKRIRKFLNHF